jgi:hypothetical protein
MMDGDDGDTLDGIIRDLKDRIAGLPPTDISMWLKLNDRLLKALSMKSRQKRSRKGRGFDLTPK